MYEERERGAETLYEERERETDLHEERERQLPCMRREREAETMYVCTLTGITSIFLSNRIFSAAIVVGPFAPSAITCTCAQPQIATCPPYSSPPTHTLLTTHSHLHSSLLPPTHTHSSLLTTHTHTHSSLPTHKYSSPPTHTPHSSPPTHTPHSSPPTHTHSSLLTTHTHTPHHPHTHSSLLTTHTHTPHLCLQIPGNVCGDLSLSCGRNQNVTLGSQQVLLSCCGSREAHNGAIGLSGV